MRYCIAYRKLSNYVVSSFIQKGYWVGTNGYYNAHLISKMCPTGRYTVAPLVAVGLEGSFGALSVLLIMPILSIPSISAQSPFFDLPRGWRQMIYTPSVLWSSVAIACSISLFNYFGLSVTRHVSATARSLTDTCRTLSIWLISLALGWEKLLFPISVLQVLGFSLLVCVFRYLVRPVT